ncbi:MAG: hypothetical protein NTW25_02245 [Candidatus Kapabacteria bacterium]|nr:hypothetical protein [Candidatus Kapabacteria bacterium]
MHNLLIKILLLVFLTCDLSSQSKYTLPCPPLVLQNSETILISQVGVKEKTGNNDGFEVEQSQYLASVNLKRGNPYCNAGQYWCFSQVTNENPNDNPMVKSGLAISTFNKAKKQGTKVNFKPDKHDLIVWNNKGKITGHIERIIEVGQKGWVSTVGFNTSSGMTGNQRDGGGVWKRKRNLYHFLGRMQLLGLVGWRS